MLLPSLGKLNADLLTAYYGDSTPSTRHIEHMLKTAQSLYGRARHDAYQASNQDRFEDEERNLEREAVWSRHVAKHTTTPNTICTGPCVHMTRADLHSIRNLTGQLQGDSRPTAVKQLASRLANITPSNNKLNPRMCEHTGIPCRAAHVERSRDSDNISAPKKRTHSSQQILREARHTLDFAKLVASSQVRELDATERNVERMDMDMSGGGQPRQSTPDTIRNFFKVNQLGGPPDTGDIRVALDSLTHRIAPRARDTVKIDMWARWMNM